MLRDGRCVLKGSVLLNSPLVGACIVVLSLYRGTRAAYSREVFLMGIIRATSSERTLRCQSHAVLRRGLLSLAIYRYKYKTLCRAPPHGGRCVWGRAMCTQWTYFSGDLFVGAKLDILPLRCGTCAAYSREVFLNRQASGHRFRAVAVLSIARCVVKGSFVEFALLGAAAHGRRCVVERTLCHPRESFF